MLGSTRVAGNYFCKRRVLWITIFRLPVPLKPLLDEASLVSHVPGEV